MTLELTLQTALSEAARQLRAARLTSGLSPETLAKRALVSNKTIREIEKEADKPQKRRKLPRLASIVRLALALKMDATGLLQRLAPELPKEAAEAMVERERIALGPAAKANVAPRKTRACADLLEEAGLGRNFQEAILSNDLLYAAALKELQPAVKRLKQQLEQTKADLQA